MAISKHKQELLHKKRRKQILDVSLSLFYQHGYINTRITDIAEAAGISKGLVYRYFDSKEDILFSYKEAMQICLDELTEYNSPKAAIKEFGIRLLSDPEETKYLPPLRIFITTFIRGEISGDNKDNPISNDFGKRFFLPLFKKGQDMGEFRNGDAEEFAIIYWHYLLGCMADMIQNNLSSIDTSILDTVIRLFDQ